jgi:ABC-type lipoprotein export system ATPase subunit
VRRCSRTFGFWKSTLLLVLAGWEVLDEGVVDFDSIGQVRPRASLSWDELTVVPQLLGLVPELTVMENIMRPVRLSPRLDGASRVAELMETPDVYTLRDRGVEYCSLGEQQRVAVCRALAHSPAIVLADEPTVHQHGDHAQAVTGALRSLAAQGCAVVIGTHDVSVIRNVDRIVSMTDGALQP